MSSRLNESASSATCLRLLQATDTLPLVVQSLGLDWDERVLPSIGNEILKAVVAQYNAEQLLTQRDRVSRAVRPWRCARRAEGLRYADVRAWAGVNAEQVLMQRDRVFRAVGPWRYAPLVLGHALKFTPESGPGHDPDVAMEHATVTGVRRLMVRAHCLLGCLRLSE